jgi:3-dehydroquinate dehydratase
MSWMIVAFDDDTLGAVLDDARVRSLDDTRDFVLVTPRSDRWGNERAAGEDYLTELDDRVDLLRAEGVEIEHEWVPGEDLIDELVEVGRAHAVDGVVIAHHNPDDSIPDPESFDDRLRQELDLPLDVISLE